ncbi:MAG: arylsulfatase [Planctomycetes bacterium]|nr:arylsulfatase [Planctomycetota bacterium]
MSLTRRGFVTGVCAGAGAALLAPWNRLLAAGAAPAGRLPNLVYILADDMGWADVGCYGQTKIRTPCLDRMAAEGMRFTDFYAGGTVCIPSRCSLMTGLHAGHMRLRSNNHRPLLDEDVTIPEVLRDAGYATGTVGKWALGDNATGPGAPHKQGWDYYYGEPNQTIVHSYYLPHLWEFDRTGQVSRLPPDREMRQVPLPGNQDGGRKEYSHDLLTEKALAFIDARKDVPFFLYVAYTIPHSNYEVPSIEPYEKESWPMGEKIYAAMVTRMDTDIGRILERLKRHGIDGNTLVLFASDNGPTNGGKGEAGHSLAFFSSAGPLRGNKGNLYEGGIRVPLIARWPGRVPPGSVAECPGAFCDIFPTFADLAGAKPPANLDGVSLVPTLTGQGEKQKRREYLYWEFGGAQAVRMDRWKAVRPKAGAAIELYDLKAGVGEKNDVAAANPEPVARADRFFQEAHTEDTYAAQAGAGKAKKAKP